MKKFIVSGLLVMGLMVGTAHAARQLDWETVHPPGKTMQLTSLTNIVDDEIFSECGGFTFSLSGKIIKVDYAKKKVTITGFILATDSPKNGRQSINFDGPRLPRSIDMIGTLIAVGKKVQVEGFRCGNSGGFFHADTVKSF